MNYLIYLLAMVFLLAMGSITTVTIVPSFELHINFANLINFLDIWGIVLLLAILVVILFFTRTLLPLKDAMLLALGKKDVSDVQVDSCLLAVNTVMISTVSVGGLMFLISLVNLIKGMDMETGCSSFGIQFSQGALSLVYAGIVVLIMLPVYIQLKRSMSESGEIVLRNPTKRKAKR